MEKTINEQIQDIAGSLPEKDCVVLLWLAQNLQTNRDLDLRGYVVTLAADVLNQCVKILEDYPFAENRRNLDFNNILILADYAFALKDSYEALRKKNATE